MKFKAMLGPETSALPASDETMEFVSRQPVGMMNQGPGMIGAADMFGTDRMPMDAQSVNARHTV